MKEIEEAERAIDGVGRLGRLDRTGGEGFGRDASAASRSFLAYALVAPAIALQVALDVTLSTSTTPGVLAVADLVGDVIQAAGFPLLLLPVLTLYRRRERWAWFVTGYNWLSAARLVLSLGVLGLCLGPLHGLGALPYHAFTGYAWVIEAFMAEAILDIGGWKAASIVLLDAFFSLAVGLVATWIGGGSLF
jgi:hypothetical protein